MQTGHSLLQGDILAIPSCRRRKFEDEDPGNSPHDITLKLFSNDITEKLSVYNFLRMLKPSDVLIFPRPAIRGRCIRL
jgi:hypothetical protein